MVAAAVGGGLYGPGVGIIPRSLESLWTLVKGIQLSRVSISACADIDGAGEMYPGVIVPAP